MLMAVAHLKHMLHSIAFVELAKHIYWTSVIVDTDAIGEAV